MNDPTTQVDVGQVGLVLAILLAVMMALLSWALKRLGNARDREIDTVSGLQALTVSVEHVRTDMARIETVVTSQTAALQALRDAVGHEARSTAIELSGLRARLEAHLSAGGGHHDRATPGPGANSERI